MKSLEMQRRNFSLVIKAKSEFKLPKPSEICNVCQIDLTLLSSSYLIMKVKENYNSKYLAQCRALTKCSTMGFPQLLSHWYHKDHSYSLQPIPKRNKASKDYLNKV